MQLSFSDISLMLWSFVCAASLLLTMLSLYRLARLRHTGPHERLFWALVVVLLPVAGAVVFLTRRKTSPGQGT